MKRLCAWCGRELDQSEAGTDSRVTHGVCQTCRRRFFASMKEKEADARLILEELGNDSSRAGEHLPLE